MGTPKETVSNHLQYKLHVQVYSPWQGPVAMASPTACYNTGNACFAGHTPYTPVAVWLHGTATAAGTSNNIILSQVHLPITAN